MSVGLTPQAVASGRSAILLGTVMWLALHCTLGISSAIWVRHWGLFIFAMVAGASVSMFAVRAALLAPGHPSTRVTTPEAIALCLTPAAIQALCLISISPAGYSSYANWAAGGMSVVILALMFRGRPGYAVAAGAIHIAVLVTIFVHSRSWRLAAWLEASFHSIPATLAVVLSGWAAYTFARSRQLAEQYRRRTADEAADQATQVAMELMQQRRFSELHESSMPTLQRIARGDTGEGLRQEAATVAQEVRDSLRARVLLTDQARQLIRAIRARGGTVVLSCDQAIDASDDADAGSNEQRQDFVHQVLEIPGLVSVRLHVSAEPDECAAVVTFAAGAPTAVPAAFETHPDFSVFVLGDDELLITRSLENSG